MSYVGNQVEHKVYGSGKIVEEGNGLIWVEFPNNTKYAANRYCFHIPEDVDKGFILIDGFEATDSEEDDANSSDNKYRDLYKRAFFEYLNEEKVKRDGTPYKMDTVAIDAFYLEKHSKKRDFLKWMDSDESMNEARKELTRLLEKAGGPRVQTRIREYFRSLSKLREYLKLKGVL